MSKEEEQQCIRVASAAFPPHTLWFPPNTTVTKTLGGVVPHILTYLAHSIGRCVVYVTNSEDTYGKKLDNGSWTGCIGMVNRDEADMTTVMSIDQYRYHAGEISEYFIMDEHSAAYRRPGVQSDIIGFIRPFTPLVWVLVLVTVLMVLVDLSLLSHTQHYLDILPIPSTRSCGCEGTAVQCVKQESNPTNQPQNINRDAVFWTICTLLAQSVPLEPPRGVVKSLTGLWLLLSFILATVYRSNLKAMLILPKVTLPFNNLEELVVADPNSLLGGLNRTIYNAGEPQNTAWGAAGLVQGAHVITVPKLALLQVMDVDYSKTGQCSMYRMEESFMKTNIICLLFKKGSPFKHKFNSLIRSMREFGILHHSYQRALMIVTRCLETIKSNSLRPLSLGDFYGVFSIYLGGLYIAFNCFLVELLRTAIVKGRRRSPHRNIHQNPQQYWPQQGHNEKM
ncbi:hypothetical protein Pcinc_030354 [Petrolisthes cinctipes]|uniref:Ionotropic glutamate receptor C-terminal domain-containing protein n=1 Tax=Petrolisthes cinctipes TaxID=88211 RepID=A0AAE1K4L3_PETCI|nr:hypothetical protein Pcinc_030354 [Petrolisthes cinctipes]